MTGHLVRLGDTEWFLWRESALRGAGFPGDYVRQLGSLDALHETGDFDDAVTRSSTVLKQIGTDPSFVEAVTWQNPNLVNNWLRNLDPTDVALLGRRKELAITSYVQRYATKNDTIGFFGPVAWAVWTDGERALDLAVGPQPLARRTVYFESWAIDTVAGMLSDDPELKPWLRPRLVASCLLDGNTVHRPHGGPVELSEAEAALLARCDGVRTVRELGSGALAKLEVWRDMGIVELSFEGPVEARPEVTLRRKLTQIGDQGPRTRAVALLDELIAARDVVAAAAGNPGRLLAAVRSLHRTFERVTGQAPTRRHGRAYAGRTVVYEDTVRGVSAQLGRPLMNALAPPLALLLTSARWLLGRAAECYHQALVEIFEACRPRTGAGSVPLATLLGRATPYFAERTSLPPPLAVAVAELQDKWARVLQVPEGIARHTVSGEAIRERVYAEFPRTKVPWASARYFSPDVMLAAADVAALNAGDFMVVLGELHLAINTLESRPMVEQHPEPARLLASSEADHGDRRIYSVPTKAWPQVNSRTYPPALLSPTYTYWCLRSDDTGAPGPVLPAAGLRVERAGDRLVVRSQADGSRFDLMEVLGEQLSAAVADCFTPVPPAPHVPRVAIDRVVFQREAWTFNAVDMTWVHSPRREDRFRLAQAWRAEQGVPMRAFYKVPGERKPTYVDFGAVSLLELFAKAVRRSERGLLPVISVVEMLPDLDQTWLTDGQGASYTAELRLVVVDPGWPA